jgi:type I restriction enzyme S subunit
MSFPRYPTYKTSGVEWLGEVPEHWGALPLRRLIRKVTSGTSVNAIDEPASPGQAGVLKTSCVYTGEFRPEENKAILESELDRATCPVVAGSLVVSRMNTPDLVGAAGLVKNDDPFLFLPDRLWLVSFQDCDPQFMNYWCKSVSYRSQVQLACSGTSSSMQNLSQDNFYSFIAPLPPTDEQSAVATFLDHETAKIDTLIAEQQRLIELLQEKRQAVISHAVTKGLNPDAPMKDSGVEWLGEVPEHWDVRKISQLFVGIGSGTTPKSDEIEYYEDGDIPWVVTGDLNDELLGSCSNFITRKAIQAHTTLRLYPKGSVAVAMYGATIGKAALFGLEATVNQACCVLPPSVKVNENFLLHFIISARNHLISLATGGGQPNINQDIVRSLRISIPEVDEQIEIVEHLSKILDELEGLLRLSDRQVLLLQERRSALISAAVTGQIDVRGLVPEAEAA